MSIKFVLNQNKNGTVYFKRNSTYMGGVGRLTFNNPSNLTGNGSSVLNFTIPAATASSGYGFACNPKAVGNGTFTAEWLQKLN